MKTLTPEELQTLADRYAAAPRTVIYKCRHRDAEELGPTARPKECHAGVTFLTRILLKTDSKIKAVLQSRKSCES